MSTIDVGGFGEGKYTLLVERNVSSISRIRDSGIESCAVGTSFSVLDRCGYFYPNSLRALIAAWLDASQIS